MYFFSIKAFLILAIVIVKIVYLGLLASRASRVALIVYSFLYNFLLNFRFSIRYGVSIIFGFRLFKYPFYSRVLVLLVHLYTKRKLLLSLEWYSS